MRQEPAARHFIEKSSRHARIAGDFGEAFLLYWLSRSGYEVCRVDHTGIDLLVYHSRTRHRLGISVKCRTRLPGSEAEGVSVTAAELPRIRASCKAYAAEPFLGIVVDRSDAIEAHLVSLATARVVNGVGKKVLNFKLGKSQVERYKASPGYFGLTLRYSEVG